MRLFEKQRPTNEQVEDAASRILAAVSKADPQYGRFSAYLPAPYSFLAELSTERVRVAAQMAASGKPIQEPTSLRLLALVLRENDQDLKSWSTCNVGQVADTVSISARDLLTILREPPWR